MMFVITVWEIRTCLFCSDNPELFPTNGTVDWEGSLEKKDEDDDDCYDNDDRHEAEDSGKTGRIFKWEIWEKEQLTIPSSKKSWNYKFNIVSCRKTYQFLGSLQPKAPTRRQTICIMHRVSCVSVTWFQFCFDQFIAYIYCLISFYIKNIDLFVKWRLRLTAYFTHDSRHFKVFQIRKDKIISDLCLRQRFWFGVDEQ